ncbi:MAG: MlaD family protein [Thermoanaerobaculales bacterium]|nr:MlaD family protein [Thermoanaerobaculales bacterium]
MSGKQHDFTTTEIRAGALVLVSLAILVGFVAAVRGCRPQDDSAKTFHAVFTNISGLNRGADVRFGGVRGGRVVAIESDPDDRSRIRISAEVEGHIPVNEGSIATIEQITLTAEKHLEISTGSAKHALLESGATLKSGAAGGLFDMPGLDNVLARLETLLDGFINLVGVDVRERGGAPATEVVDLADLILSLDTTLKEGTGVVRGINEVIGDNRVGIKEVVDRLAALEETATTLVGQLNAVVEENRVPIRETFTNLQQLTGEMDVRVEELAATLQATLQYFQDVGGNSSDLIDQQRPTIEETLENLQETTRNLREFSRILAEQPQALIRGKAAQGRPSEEKK